MNNVFISLFSLLFGLGMMQSPQTVIAPDVQPIPQTQQVTDYVQIQPTTEDVQVDAPPTGITELSDKGQTLVQNTLLDPLSKFNKVAKDMFSRCGSGFYQSNDYNATPDFHYYYGVISYDIGCGESQNVAKFRVNSDETTVEVWNATTKKYITPTAWLTWYENQKGRF